MGFKLEFLRYVVRSLKIHRRFSFALTVYVQNNWEFSFTAKPFTSEMWKRLIQSNFDTTCLNGNWVRRLRKLRVCRVLKRKKRHHPNIYTLSGAMYNSKTHWQHSYDRSIKLCHFSRFHLVTNALHSDVTGGYNFSNLRWYWNTDSQV